MTKHLKNRAAILRPRVTEKSSMISEANVYTFEVDPSATKHDVARNILEIYKITPVKVNMSTNPSKKVTYKGKMGRTKGIKKAYVYLKEGDKIDI